MTPTTLPTSVPAESKKRPYVPLTLEKLGDLRSNVLGTSVGSGDSGNPLTQIGT